MVSLNANREIQEPMPLQIRRVVSGIKRMSPQERIQLLVKAGLMTQDEADRAKKRVNSDPPSPDHRP